MHRVPRRSDCHLLLEKTTKSSSSPTSSTALLNSPSPHALNNNCLKNADPASAQLSAAMEGADWAAGGGGESHEGDCDNNRGAASVALLQENYDAALAKIKTLEAKVARLEEQQVEIHAAKELYLKVFEDFPALIWRSGLDKMCDYFNRTWLEWTGKTMEQELGLGWTNGVHPDDFDECLKIYTTAFDARTAFCIEYRLLDKYGQYRWIRDHGRPFYDLDDTFLGYIGSCYDITENKTNEHRLAALNKTKDKLFGLVTYDLRHPVATFVSLSDFLQQYNSSLGGEELCDIAMQMHDEARKTLGMVDNLLKWTRAQQSGAGGPIISFKPQPLMSQDLFRQVLSQVSLCAKAKKLRVIAGNCVAGGSYDEPMEDEEDMNFDERADNIMMVGDKDMVVTILRNLVMNSIRFTHPGGFIELKAQKLDQETVLLSVTDTGVGMPETTRLELFDNTPTSSSLPQAPRRGTGNELGSGMGTVLCRDFVERHEGRIWVAQSEPDRGTTIQMTLPAAMAQLKRQEVEEEEVSHIYYKLGVA